MWLLLIFSFLSFVFCSSVTVIPGQEYVVETMALISLACVVVSTSTLIYQGIRKAKALRNSDP